MKNKILANPFSLFSKLYYRYLLYIYSLVTTCIIAILLFPRLYRQINDDNYFLNTLNNSRMKVIYDMYHNKIIRGKKSFKTFKRTRCIFIYVFKRTLIPAYFAAFYPAKKKGIYTKDQNMSKKCLEFIGASFMFLTKLPYLA